MNTLFYKKVIGPVLFFFIAFVSHSQEIKKDTTKANELDEVLVSALRVTSKTPVSFSNLNKKEIASRNLGQDIPTLMNFMPSVVTTLVAPKPQVPFAITRTPTPNDSVLATPCTRLSRVVTN